MTEPLFKIGENGEGFYVYPTTDPPKPGHMAGSEVSRDQAIAVCDSLNHAVYVYVAERLEQSQAAMYGVLGAISYWEEYENSGRGLEEVITEEMRRDLREAAKAGTRGCYVRM